MLAFVYVELRYEKFHSKHLASFLVEEVVNALIYNRLRLTYENSFLCLSLLLFDVVTLVCF
jgi:hypothetical protein